MKLSRKVFIYTTGTTFLVGLMIIGYFIFMLPGLYTDYKSERFIQQIEGIQANNAQGENKCDLRLKDNFYVLSLSIPNNGYEIQTCNPYFSLDFEIMNQHARDILDHFREVFSNVTDEKEIEEIDFSKFEIDQSTIDSILSEMNLESLLDIRSLSLIDTMILESPVSEFRNLRDGSNLLVSSISDQSNSYSNYIAFKVKDGTTYLTLASAMTPSLTELMPIILGSTPMVLAFLILFSLLTAHWFSKKLAEPIETLANQAFNKKDTKDFVFKQSNQKDEFKTLENALNQMHQDLQKSMAKLKEQNTQLEYEKEKQIVFMMNATHQLKTPIAGASLLVESMIQEVGKYKDSKYYLPKVLEELKRVNQVLESMIISFNEVNNDTELIRIDVSELVENHLEHLNAQINAKNLLVEHNLDKYIIESDVNMLSSIIENILVNAIKYTPQSESIFIELKEDTLKVLNRGVWIDDELLPVIKDAFVRSNQTIEKGTGLGLYLVETFASTLGMTWNIENHDEGVLVTLYLES